MKKFILPLVMLLGSLAWGQASRLDGQVTGPNGQPVHSATIRVCTATATPGTGTTPCSPLATLYSDITSLNACNGPNTSCTNPFITDYQGNYHFYAAPGRVMLEVISNGVVAYDIPDQIVPCEQGVSCGGPATLSGGSAGQITVWGGPTTVIPATGLSELGGVFASTDSVDFSTAGYFNIPVQAGATPTNNGRMKYDSTSNTYKVGVNGATQTLQTVENLAATFVKTNASATFGAFAYDFSGTTSFIPRGGTTANLPGTCTHTTTQEDVYIATDATAGQNWYFCTATNVWTQQLNTGGAGGASTNLSNLNAVAFNIAITPNSGNLGTANADLGATAKPIDAVYIGAAATNNAKLTGTFTAARVLTLPDATGTLVVPSANITWTGTHTFSNNVTLSKLSSLISASGTAPATGLMNFASSDTLLIENALGNAALNFLSKDTSDIVQVGDTAGMKIAGNLNTQNNALVITPTNDATTPPVLNGPACWTSSGTVAACSTGQQSQVAGVCVGSCSASGSAKIAVEGLASCVFDSNPVTIGDYVVVSGNSGTQCADGGASATSGESIGVVYSFVSGTTYKLFVSAGSAPPSVTHNVVNNPGSSFGSGQTITSIAASTIPLIVACNSGSTVDCFQVKGPAGTVVLKVDKNGVLTIANGIGNITASQFISASSNPASSAASNVLRLASSDAISFRNNGNSADVTLSKNVSDAFVFNNGTGSVPPGLVFSSQSGNSTSFAFVNPSVSQTLTVPDSGGASDTFVLANDAIALANKSINPYLDFVEGAAPSNPSSGNCRFYSDSTTHNLTGIKSDGSSCLPTGSGGGTVSSGTGGQLTWYAANGTTVSGNSNFTVTSNVLKAAAGGFDITAASAVIQECTADAAGTAANLTVKLTTTSGTKCVTGTTADLGGIEGIALSGGASGTTTQVAIAGKVPCTFDNTTVINDIVVASPTNAGQCHDAGANLIAGEQPLGKVLTVNGGVGTNADVLLARGQLGFSGTANQITTTFANGILTLALPQNIHTSATVSFANIQLTGTGVYGANSTSSTTTFTVKDSTASDITGQAVFRGGDFTAVGGHNGGSVLLRGGNTATTGTGFAGNVDLEGGQATAVTSSGQQNGRLNFDPVYHKGATNTVNNLQCFSADNTVADCGTSATNFVGTLAALNGNAAIVIHDGNQVGVNYDATVSPSAGWFACSSATVAGKVTAQSGACAAGRTVGIIEAAGTSVTTGFVTLEHF